MEFGPVVQKMSFKENFLSRALAAPMFSGLEPFVHLCRRYYEERFCEIILNLDQWFRRLMPFKGISYLELWQAFVQWSITICAISVKGIMRNNLVKLF